MQPEVYGTKIDKDAFTEKIKEALDKMQPEFDLSGEGCYEDPKVKEEDDVFQDALDTLNKYTQMKITYQAEGKDDVVLDGETISTWLSVDDDFNVSVDDEALSSIAVYMHKCIREFLESYEGKSGEEIAKARYERFRKF